MEDWKLQPARDLGMPLGERTRSLRRECGLLETAAHQVWWSLVHGYLRLFHRLRVQGREHLPSQPPFVLVANHASHLDALVMAAPLPWRMRDHIFPIAAGDTFFETPVMSAFAALVMNALPMWRKKCGVHALEELRQRLVDGPAAYILFPEGTRTRDGQLSRFKPGIGRLVAGTAVPVIPCFLSGTFAALPPQCRVPRFRAVALTIGAPLEFASVPNEADGWREVARAAEEAVRRLGGLPESEG